MTESRLQSQGATSVLAESVAIKSFPSQSQAKTQTESAPSILCLMMQITEMKLMLHEVLELLEGKAESEPSQNRYIG